MGDEEDVAFLVAVHQGAGIEGQKQHGEELGHGDQPQFEGGMGEFQDEPGLGDPLDPGSCEGEGLPGPEESVVPVFHGGEGPGQ